MTAPILPNPRPQFCDQNGKPYIGGKLWTFVKNSTAAKPTWKDPSQLALNENPIVLDAAGRCTMFGDGDYRLILDDAAGNLIWDEPSTTAISAAMDPVVSAATLSEARDAMGVTDAITAEAVARSTEDALIVTNFTAIINATNSALAAETIARENADGQELAWRVAADNALQGQINALTSGGPPGVSVQGGQNSVTFPAAATSNVFTVAFPLAFAVQCDAVTVTATDSVFSVGLPADTLITFAAGNRTTTHVDIVGVVSSVPALPISVAFNWVAVGH